MRKALILPLLALLAGCGGDDQPAGPSPASQDAPAAAVDSAATVEIVEFKFGEPVEIAAGGSVTWTNRDSAPHNAVGEDFKTADLRGGQSDEVTFDTPGTYDYVCTFHPFMKGSVSVR